MAVLRAQVRFQRTTQVPEDQVVNTFHFQTLGAAATTPDYTSVVNRITAFFKAIPVGAAGTVGDLLSPVIANTGHEIRVYDLTDPKPRPVRATAALTLNPRSTSGLPSEVAIVLSLRAAPIAGVNPGRLRGRVYIGPLILGATAATVSSGDVRPDAAAQTTIVSAGSALQVPASSTEPQLAVFSTIDGVARPVVQVVVDNAFDTQRRRGATATARLIRP